MYNTLTSSFKWLDATITQQLSSYNIVLKCNFLLQVYSILYFKTGANKGITEFYSAAYNEEKRCLKALSVLTENKQINANANVIVVVYVITSNVLQF